MDPLIASAAMKTGVAAKKVRSAKTLLGTNQLTPLSEACDQQIIANLLITLHSPQTTTLRQIP